MGTKKSGGVAAARCQTILELGGNNAAIIETKLIWHWRCVNVLFSTFWAPAASDARTYSAFFVHDYYDDFVAALGPLPRQVAIMVIRSTATISRDR
jgi:hypothetical protein